MNREMITREELEGKLREQGVEDIAEVRIARLESDGTLSVFKKRGDGSSPPTGGAPRELGPPSP